MVQQPTLIFGQPAGKQMGDVARARQRALHQPGPARPLAQPVAGRALGSSGAIATTGVLNLDVLMPSVGIHRWLSKQAIGFPIPSLMPLALFS